ncbi:MAG: hypothetical protein MJZ55_05130, partial [Paludibacteraceae bacterium]|nr:hypothetical protein [Paludibacteraceae bacterium]
WMTQFTSVGTGAARLQHISPNPQKLAGQCAKLKCCLNYEVPVYEDAKKRGEVLGSPVVDDVQEEEIGFQNAVGEGDVTRFDKKRKNNNFRRNDRQKSRSNRPQ